MAEGQLGFRPAEAAQAAALAEQGVGALGHVPELLPAYGRFGIKACCGGVVAGVLDELGAGGAKRVFVERVVGLKPVDEPLGERGVASGEGGSASFRSAIASRIASPARTARSASSSCATGAPRTAMTASPTDFSTGAPYRSISCRNRAW